MNEELNNQPNALDHNDYEREDLSPAGVLYFMAGLAVVGILIYFVVEGMYNFLDRYEREHQATFSPLVTPKAETRIITHADTQVFPQPRLEENERTQLREFIENQENTLATYDWVDKQQGIVRIPIERAMDLIAERGLPVRPEGAEASAPAASSKTKAQSAGSPAGASQ